MVQRDSKLEYGKWGKLYYIKHQKRLTKEAVSRVHQWRLDNPEKAKAGRLRYRQNQKGNR